MLFLAKFSAFCRRSGVQYGKSFSYVGLVCATLFFAASLTPTLLPRDHTVQGILSGIALAAGYAVGVSLTLLWRFLELPIPGERIQRTGKWIAGISVSLVTIGFLWRATVWQNSIRQLMQMPKLETADPFRVFLIALVTGMFLIAVARLLRLIWAFLDRKVNRLAPRRISYVVSLLCVAVLVFLLVNNLLAKFALDIADEFFLALDMAVDEGIEQPQAATASGSADSLIPWSTIGRRGKNFVVDGPTAAEISEYLGRPAQSPLRVYVGLGTRPEMADRAELALQELIRVDAFSRSVLIVATPTGTGWLDPGAVNTVEYLHAGDTAIVSMAYSYLPSWITILVDPHRSRESAQALFNTVYHYWKSLPHDQRPRLYLHGLSLGSLGSESSADLFTIFEDPIQGGLWSGPPFPSPVWNKATRERDPDSPMWMPRFRDGRMLRFTGQKNHIHELGDGWGPMRYVYIQHASDPMVFFSPTLLYRRPGWLRGERGPDVSPYFDWLPLITFLQTGFDIPMATSVPIGYGHNYSPESYIDGWIAVTDPAEWPDDEIERLKEHFRQLRLETASSTTP